MDQCTTAFNLGCDLEDLAVIFFPLDQNPLDQNLARIS